MNRMIETSCELLSDYSWIFGEAQPHQVYPRIQGLGFIHVPCCKKNYLIFAGLMSPRSSGISGVKTDVSTGLALQEEREAATRDDWEDGLILTKSKTSLVSSSPLQDIVETGGTNSKSDFLRQMDLMTVDQHQV